MKIREKLNNVDSWRKNGIKVFTGLRDAFNNPFLLAVNDDLKEIKLLGKNPDYRSSRKELDKKRLNHVIVPEFIEVIDISRKTEQFILDIFPGYRHPQFQVWD